VKAGQVRRRVDLTAVRRFLTALAVLQPQVRFSLRACAEQPGQLASRLLQTSGSNNLRTVCGELAAAGGASAAVAADPTSMRALQYGAPKGVNISGMVSTRPCATKDFQFLCVNRRYVVDSQLAWEIEVRNYEM
jgi:DNA mismatch repair ATPase MutL